jgi:hypothetical protein
VAVAAAVLCASCSRSSKLSVPPPQPGPADAAACARLIAALPGSIDTGVPTVATSPVSPLTKAYGKRSAPVVVRCGVGLPKGFQPTSQLLVLDPGAGPVGWFDVTRGTTTVLTAVRRTPHVELTIPSIYRADVVLGNVSITIGKTLPRGTDTLN